MSRPALSRLLEFSRATEAGDEFGFRFERQDYIQRNEDGSVDNAELPWSEQVLADLSALQRERPDRAAAQRLGDLLRGFLGKLSWKAFEQQLVQAIDAKQSVHITIRSAAAELYALPFELITLRSTGQHLGELPGCLLRYEWPGTRSAKTVPDPPAEGGRILFAWSAAGGAVPAQAHLAALRKACQGGHHPFDDVGDVVSNVTRDRLSAALADKDNAVRVLHLLCHGGATTSATPSYGLVWNGAEGGEEPDIVDAASLRHLLAPHVGSLRLVVLCACHGGATGALGNHLGSVAQALHRLGIPAVVASRYPLSVDGSVAIAETLYHALLAGLCSLEDAWLATRERLAKRTDLFDWASIQLFARKDDRSAHRPFAIRPYRGLAAFQRADTRFFFGREEEVARLLALLRAGQRLVTVVGASGSGKSSLVLAGLVPTIERGALGQGVWRVRILRPGVAPCNALATAIRTLEGDATEDHGAMSVRIGTQSGTAEDPLAKELASHPEALAAAAMRALGGRQGTERLLLVVDQFEEVFTQAERGQAHGFIDNLLHATAAPGVRVHAVFTLRGDFYGHCLDQRALAERIGDAQVIAFPMKSTQIREAIEHPAELVGLEFDGGIIDALVDALREGSMTSTIPGADPVPLSSSSLPLLQFALEELWKRRQDDRIVWGAWKSIGGVRGALAQRAEEVLEQFPSDDDRALIRHMFGRLVQLGDGTVDTRRYAPRHELEAIRPERAGQVLNRWIDSRLLVTDQSIDDVAQVGVAHEALIREWHTLRRWINDSRNALRVRQELSHAADRWKANDRSADDLWRGGRLRLMLDVQEKHELPLSELERDFLGAAKAAEDRVKQAEEERHQRELTEQQERAKAAEALAKTAQNLAASEHRKRRAGQALLAVSVLAVAIVAFLAYRAREAERAAELNADEASRQADEANRQRTIAHDAAQIAAARSAIENDPTTAVILLRDLVQPEADTSWFETALEALWRPQAELILHHDLALTAAAYSPDGKHVLTASEDRTVKIWSTAESTGVTMWGDTPIALLGHPEPVNGAAWSPDGKRILTVTRDGSLRIWPFPSAQDPVLIRHGDGARIRAASWSPDSAHVLTIASDNAVRICLTDGKEMARLPHDRTVSAFVFSPDGAHVLTASNDGIARVWSVQDPGKPTLLKGHKGPILSAVWSPDGKHVATAGSDTTARIAPADGKGKAVLLEGHDDAVVSVAFSPDGKRVVTASRDKTVRIWRVDGKDGKGHEMVLRGHRGALIDASFNKDGTRILSTSDGQTPRIWDPRSGEGEVELRGHSGSTTAASWSPSDGRHVITASTDKTARVWDPDSVDDLQILHRFGAPVVAASWSPDDKRILTVFADGTAQISRAGGQPEGPPLRSIGPIKIASWSPGGERVLTVDEGGTARLWTAEGVAAVTLEGETRVAAAGQSAMITAAVWSPDGKRVATASDDAAARIWDASGAPGPPMMHHAPVTVVAFRPDGTQLLTGSDDATARVWSTGGQAVCTMQHASPVRAAAWSADGKKIVTASDKDGVRVWDGACTPIRPVQDADSHINAVFFNPDATRVVTTSNENTVRLWHIDKRAPPLVLVGTSASLSPPRAQSKELVLTTPRSFPLTARVYFADSDREPIQLKGHEQKVWSARWSHDGRRILTGANDKTARIWLFDQDLLFDAMCKVNRAFLSKDERRAYLGGSVEHALAPARSCDKPAR